uniref:hypothetical protein n=1 Tax=Xanthomonas sp. GW TaxID=2724121 RepID=UPI001C8CF6A2|nr:hypothetical protein [Xanthomonas sp. GW]
MHANRCADVAHQILRLEPLAPHPDRLGVRHLAAVFQSKELLETAPIQHLVLQRIVREVVQLLQQQQFDHDHRRPGRTAPARAGAQGQLRIDGLGNRCEIDMARQHRQRVAYLLALGLAFVSGKQSDHRATSAVG